MIVVSESGSEIDAQVVILCDRSISNKNYRCNVKITQDARLVSIDINLPDKTGYYIRPADITLISSDEEVLHRERINPLRIVTGDKYFEHLVLHKLKDLGFQTEWLSGRDPGNPDIKAIFRLYPREVFDIECTIEESYDVSKLYADYAKFMSEKRTHGFTRLVIIPLTSNVVGGVTDKMREYDEPITLIRYADLLQLFEQKRAGTMGKEEIYVQLTQRGEVMIPQIYSVDPEPRKQVTFEVLCRF